MALRRPGVRIPLGPQHKSKPFSILGERFVFMENRYEKKSTTYNAGDRSIDSFFAAIVCGWFFTGYKLGGWKTRRWHIYAALPEVQRGCGRVFLHGGWRGLDRLWI